MGIMDKVSSLLPARSGSSDRRAPQTQALALKDDFDRWLLQFFEEPWGYPIEYPSAAIPEVHETDREFVVRVEAPGFEASDLDLSMRPGMLVIKGQRRDNGREQRMVQSVAVPPDSRSTSSPPSVSTTSVGPSSRGGRSLT